MPSFTMNDVHRYHSQGMATVDVILDYSAISSKERAAVLTSLSTGVIPTYCSRGSGKVAYDLLVRCGVSFLHTSTASRHGNGVNWAISSTQDLDNPLFADPLCEFLVAASVANALEGKTHEAVFPDKAAAKEYLYGHRTWYYAPKIMASADKLRSIMFDYTQTDDYKSKVTAAIDVVRTGASLRFTVK